MKLFSILSFSVLLTLFSIPNQDLKAQEKRTISKLKKVGVNLMKYEAWGEALEIYQTLDSLQPNNPTTLFHIGKCTYHSADKPGSLIYFLKAYNLGLHDRELLYYVAKGYQFNYDIANALNFVLLYKSRIDSLSEEDKPAYTRAILLISQIKKSRNILDYKLSVAIENLGDKINSNSPDYVPISLSSDSTLIFTSRRPGSIGGKLAIDGLHHEDIYISRMGPDGDWTLPSHIPGFNGSHHDASVAISHDERTLYIYKAKNNGDIFYARENGEKWSKPKPLTEINTKFWEGSVSLSPTEDTLYFSSDRPGGFGGSDLYIATRDSTNKWSNIRNMGPEINSPLDDDAPYIHKDGKTFFFSSKGHNSIGGYDVFTAILFSGEKSSEVKNLGFPINTVDDDIYFQLNSTAAYGYFTSNRYSNFKHRSIGEKDIFQIKRPNSSPTDFIFKGLVGSSDSLIAIPAVIVLTDLSNPDSPPVKIIVDINNGQFRTDLQFDNHYELRVEIGDKVYFSKKLFYPYQANLFESFLKIHLSPIPEFEVRLRDVIGSPNQPKEQQNLEANSHQSIVLVRSVSPKDSELKELLMSSRIPLSFQLKLTEQIEQSKSIDEVDKDELKETLGNKWPADPTVMSQQISKINSSKIESITTPNVAATDGRKSKDCQGLKGLSEYEQRLIARIRNIATTDSTDTNLYAADIAYFQSLDPNESECFFQALKDELRKCFAQDKPPTSDSIFFRLTEGLERIQDKLRSSSNFVKLMKLTMWGKLYTIETSHFKERLTQRVRFKGKVVWRSSKKPVKSERLLLTNSKGLICGSTHTNDLGEVSFDDLQIGEQFHILVNDYAIALTGQSRYELVIESIETKEDDFLKFYDSLSFTEKRMADRLISREILDQAYINDPIAKEEDSYKLSKLSAHHRELVKQLQKYLNARSSDDDGAFLDKQDYYDYLQIELSERDNFNRQIALNVKIDENDSAFYNRLTAHQKKCLDGLKQYRSSRKQLLDQVAFNENETNYWYTVGWINTSADNLPPYVTVHAKVSGDSTEDSSFKVALLDESMTIQYLAETDSVGNFTIPYVPLNKKYHVIITNGKNLPSPENYKVTDLRLEGGEIDFYNSLSATEKRRIDRHIALSIAEAQYVGEPQLLKQDIERYNSLPKEYKDYIKRIQDHLLADTVTNENTHLSGSDNYQYYSVLSAKDREFINRLATRNIQMDSIANHSVTLSNKDQVFFKKVLPYQYRQLQLIEQKRKADRDIIAESPSLIVDKAWQFVKSITFDSTNRANQPLPLHGRLYDATIGEYKGNTPIMITNSENKVIKIITTDSTGYFSAKDLDLVSGYNLLAETSQFLLNRRTLVVELIDSDSLIESKQEHCTINFDFDSDQLVTIAQNRLIKFFKHMEKISYSRILIVGHTDEVGSNNYNFQLGLRRAKNTRAFLGKLGINSANIAVMSDGENLPVNKMAQKKNQLNRRVEITVD